MKRLNSCHIADNVSQQRLEQNVFIQTLKGNVYTFTWLNIRHVLFFFKMELTYLISCNALPHSKRSLLYKERICSR